jgi:hypothetical protein
LVSGLFEDALTAFAFGWAWSGRRVESGLFWMGVTKVSDIFVTGDNEHRTRSMVLRIERLSHGGRAGSTREHFIRQNEFERVGGLEVKDFQACLCARLASHQG